MKIDKLNAVSFALALTPLAILGNAQAAYPDHVVTAVVPFAAGSSNDTLARIITPHLSQTLGQPVIVSNKPGADALIGIGDVAKAQPDGYTILFSGAAVVLAPALHKSINYDPVKQIMGVAEIGTSPYIIAVNTKLGIDNLKDLVAYIKSHPGKLNVPASGNSSRVDIELFKYATQTQFTIVNYNGTGAAATSLLTGETDFALLDSLSFESITPDRVKLVAVTGDTRIPSKPEIPTTKEAGLPQYTASALFGVYGTGGMPQAAAEKLNVEVNKALKLPDVVSALAKLGVDPVIASQKDFDKLYHDELKSRKELVIKAKIPMAD